MGRASRITGSFDGAQTALMLADSLSTMLSMS